MINIVYRYAIFGFSNNIILINFRSKLGDVFVYWANKK